MRNWFLGILLGVSFSLTAYSNWNEFVQERGLFLAIALPKGISPIVLQNGIAGGSLNPGVIKNNSTDSEQEIFWDKEDRGFLLDWEMGLADVNQLLVPGSDWTIHTITCVNNEHVCFAIGSDSQERFQQLLLIPSKDVQKIQRIGMMLKQLTAN